jgi:hypothetical protein
MGPHPGYDHRRALLRRMVEDEDRGRLAAAVRRQERRMRERLEREVAALDGENRELAERRAEALLAERVRWRRAEAMLAREERGALAARSAVGPAGYGTAAGGGS